MKPVVGRGMAVRKTLGNSRWTGTGHRALLCEQELDDHGWSESDEEFVGRARLLLESILGRVALRH